MMGVSDAEKTRLYLRLPVKIVDEEQVRGLHPAIQRVILPRQKSRRWCTVEVESGRVKAVVKELKAVKVDDKKVYVSVHRKKQRQE